MARNRVWQMELMDEHRAGRVTDEELLRAPTGVGRKVALRKCGCGEPVLAGLDGNRCALAVAVDPYPLTAAGEVWALTDGRHTYRVWHGQLDLRDRWNIPGHPAGVDETVLASHRCDQLVPLEHRAPPAPPRPAPAATEGIPF